MRKHKHVKKHTPQTPSHQRTIETAPFHFTGKKFHYFFAISAIVFCFVLYGNGIRNGFSLDDEFVLHSDTLVQKGISVIPKLFKMRYGWDQKGKYGYRPVATATFAIECTFFGVSPHAGHVINICMYALLCIFLFYLLRKVFYNEVSDYFLFVVIALFIAHPLHTEVVDSLKNRDELLVCLFGFYACFAFIKAFDAKKITVTALWIISAISSFNLGLLSKPDEILFVAIIPLILFFYFKNNRKPFWLSLLLLFIGLICHRLFMHLVLPLSHYHRTFIFIEDPLIHTHWYQRIALGFYAFWFYIKKLVFPWYMACYYGYAEVNPFPQWTNLSVVMGVIAAACLLYFIFKNKKNRGILLFSLLCFAGTLFIYLDILKVGPGIVADRFMFIPSLGFTLCLALLLFHYAKVPLLHKPYGSRKQYLYMVTGIIIFIYSVRTIARNPNWKSHISLYSHDVKSAPRSAKLQSLLAAALVQKIQANPTMPIAQKADYYQTAEKAYAAALTIYPEYATSLNNLGEIEFTYRRNYTAAYNYFARAIKIDTNYAIALFNIAATSERLGKLDDAEKYYIKAIHASPKHYLTYVYLAKLYLREKEPDKVLQFNQQALAQGYVSDAIYENLSSAYFMKKDTANAIAYLEKAVIFYKKNTYLASYLAGYFIRKKNKAKADYYENLVRMQR